MPDQLPLGCAQHARVVQNDGIDFANALIRVEEDDEEHHGYAERHLRPDTQSEPKEEDRRKHDSRKRIEHPDVRIQ